jgi:hypothetical protein
MHIHIPRSRDNKMVPCAAVSIIAPMYRESERTRESVCVRREGERDRDRKSARVTQRKR